MENGLDALRRRRAALRAWQKVAGQPMPGDEGELTHRDREQLDGMMRLLDLDIAREMAALTRQRTETGE